MPRAGSDDDVAARDALAEHFQLAFADEVRRALVHVDVGQADPHHPGARGAEHERRAAGP